MMQIIIVWLATKQNRRWTSTRMSSNGRNTAAAEKYVSHVRLAASQHVICRSTHASGAAFKDTLNFPVRCYCSTRNAASKPSQSALIALQSSNISGVDYENSTTGDAHALAPARTTSISRNRQYALSIKGLRTRTDGLAQTVSSWRNLTFTKD